MSRSVTTGIKEVYLLSSMLFDILIRGTAIRATTAGLIPAKILFTTGFSLNDVKNIAIARIITKEGRALPRAAKRLPLVPDIFLPVNTDILITNTPGADCDIASASANSSSESHLFLSTTSLRISGSIAYPPPIVNVPIFAKVRNISRLIFISVQK